MATLHTYTKVNFKDKPNQTTPVNKTNLDHVEDGIVNAYTDIAALNTEKAANVPSFSQAASRVNISSGENMPTILGKIKKFFADLKTVAFSGNYNDLSNKPSSLPASDVYSWAKASSKPGYSWSEISSKPSFATVATTGNYNDLSNKPTIPTDTSQLTNGAGYITTAGNCNYANSAGYAASAGSAGSAGSASSASYASEAMYAQKAKGNAFELGTGGFKNINTRPWWDNGLKDYNIPIGDGNHWYRFNWTGSECELYVDDTKVGSITLH